MARKTERPSPSVVSCDRTSSPARDQKYSVSDVELVPLVLAVDNTIPEQAPQRSTVNSSVTKHSTDVTVHPTVIHAASPRGDTPFLQSDTSSLVSRLILDSWLCESVAMCFSIGCLVAIVFVVAAYDGERIPELASGVTINAIISVLSTASRASLIFVVSTAMGQLKWCWLRRSGRRIRDIRAMDDASRGPLGAFGVLAFWTGGSLAALGSIITLLMIAFGPFLQQLVEYPSRNTTLSGAFALAPQNFAYTRHSPSQSEENMDFLNVLGAGVWSDPKAFDQEPTCSTGHCLWTEFRSVGWCSKCENRTLSATLSNCKPDTIAQKKEDASEYCILNLGHGANFSLIRDLEVSVYLDAVNGEPVYVDTVNGGPGEPVGSYTGLYGNYTSEVIWPLSYGNSGSNLTILDVTKLSAPPTKIMGVENPLIVIGQASLEPGVGYSKERLDFNMLSIVSVSQCILHPCEKTLSLNKVNGTTTWTDGPPNYGSLVARNLSLGLALAFRRAWSNSNDSQMLCWQAEDGDLDHEYFWEESYAVDRRKRAFCPVDDYAYNIQKAFSDRYDVEFGAALKEDNFSMGGSGLSGTNVYEDVFGYEGGKFDIVGPRSTRNLSQRVESVAVALTNYGLQATNDTVRGEAIAEESYVRIRWQWIVLPAFLELASLVLLVLTVVHSRREAVPLWKSSVLALIYHAVDELRGQETLATELLSGMKITANMTDVQLVKSEDGVNSLSKRSGYRPVDQDG
jgi:hypothetical protein